MAAGTKDKTVGFFGGGEVIERSDGPNLLPTTRKDGAPKDNKWLVQFVEDSVEIRHSGDKSKTPDHPYLAYSLAVIEPVEFAGRRVFGMMYFSPEPAEDMDDDAIAKIREAQGNFRADVNHILGENAHLGIVGDDLEETLENLALQLDSIVVVAKIGKEREKDGFPAKNRVFNFYYQDTWQAEGEEDND